MSRTDLPAILVHMLGKESPVTATISAPGGKNITTFCWNDFNAERLWDDVVSLRHNRGGVVPEQNGQWTAVDGEMLPQVLVSVVPDECQWNRVHPPCNWVKGDLFRTCSREVSVRSLLLVAQDIALPPLESMAGRFEVKVWANDFTEEVRRLWQFTEAQLIAEVTVARLARLAEVR